MSPNKNETTLPPKGNSNDPGSSRHGYIIATAVVCVVAMVIVAMVLVYRIYRKRSGPLWITKVGFFPSPKIVGFLLVRRMFDSIFD
jgi:heme/copper-type cytochrome/quinol oxidase subunit 2